MSINFNDPIEAALAARLQQSAIAHVASSTSDAYVSPWNMFVQWCNSLASPRQTLPADDTTVALYLQHVLDRANSYAVIKSASAAIAFMQKVNLFDHLPTRSPLACMVRNAAARQFGLAPKAGKAPFKWADITRFAVAYCHAPASVPYCHLVIVTFCVISFGAMCRHSDLFWVTAKDVLFGPEDQYVTIKFGKRKNDQYRKGSTVKISAIQGSVCPVRLLRNLIRLSGVNPDTPVFQGFNGRLVRKNAYRTQPSGSGLKYDQYMRYLSLWFGSILDLSPMDFRAHYGAQSGRSGGASAAANAGVRQELWGAHGNWREWDSQQRYMEVSHDLSLSVSRAIMPGGALPTASSAVASPEATDEREDDDATAAADLQGDGTDIVPETEDVPTSHFTWQA